LTDAEAPIGPVVKGEYHLSVFEEPASTFGETIQVDPASYQLYASVIVSAVVTGEPNCVPVRDGAEE
jgi:hypothetical protein